MQTELRLVRIELGRAKEQVAELERVVANLKTELDAASRARTHKATNLAKDAEAPDQEGDSASEPSDAWKPQ